MQPSLTDILTRTPPQVWAILAVILILGAMQMRRRQISESNLTIMPLAMAGLSLYTVVSSFTATGSTLGPWFAAFGIAFAVNAVLLRSPARATYDPATRKFDVPGSIVPLLVMLAIFATNYALGVTRAIAPERLADRSFSTTVCAALGLLTGLLFARAARTAKAKKHSRDVRTA